MKNKNLKKTGETTVTGKPAEQIDVNPTEKSIREQVIFTFGRFNPPTIGHQRLIEYMYSLAEDTDAEVQVYLSHRYDNRKNLLEYDTKLQLCREAFGDCVVESSYTTIMEILQSLSGKYKNAIVVVGSDREMTFAERLPLYNGDLYEFEDISIIGFERSEDAISSTMMREFVKKRALKEFKENLPVNLRDQAKELSEALHLSLTDQRSADFKMVKVLSPLGKWVWRKVKRDQNVMNNKQGLAISTQKPLRPKSLIKRIVGEETTPMSTKVGQFTKKQKQWAKLQDEETMTELSQRSVISYIDKAATERGKAEHQGDTKKLKKRDKGLTSAIDRMHKWYGKR